MKNKIVSVLLLCTLLFSVFSVYSFAASDTDVLRREIEKNLPDVDLDSLAGNRIMTIGAMEDLTDETCLYLYLYNPKKLNVKSGYMNLDCSLEGASGKTSKSYDKISFSVIAKTNDSAFCKVRIDLSSISGKLAKYSLIHSYSWNSLVLKYSSLGSLKEETVLQEYEWKFDYSTGSCNVTYDVKEVATLDVNYTWYRSPYSTSSKNTYDVISTVYFSLPDGYTEFYSKLYSVASTYTKKKTAPIVIGTQSFSDVGGIVKENYKDLYMYINGLSMISSDYELSYGGAEAFYLADTGFNLHDFGTNHYTIRDKNFESDIGGYFYCDEEINKPEDFRVSRAEYLDYVNSIEADPVSFYMINLFESSEFFPWSEKTINDTFSSIAYANSIQDDFLELTYQYGLYTALQFYFYRNIPDKYQQLCDKYLVDSAKDLGVIKNLVLCDDQVRGDANNLTDQEFSDKYLIHIDDVVAFKQYLKENKNVVLYRFDIDDYYSDEVVLSSNNHGFIYNTIFKDDTFVITQAYYYFGFRVIDVKFNNNGNFVSLSVNSHPQDLGPDLGGVTEKPPISLKPLPDIKDGIDDSLIRLVISVLIVIASVAVAILGISRVLDGISSIPVKKKDKNKKNE